MFLTRWLKSPIRPRTNRGTCPRPRFRPTVEGLEAREVPAVLTVTTTADVIDPNDGLLSLREAVLQANTTATHDSIMVPAGTYCLPSGNLCATGSLTISGGGAGATVLDGTGANQVLVVDPGADVTLAGLTVRNGYGFYGGGIFNAGDLTIRDSVIAENTAALGGGGIYNTGTVKLVRSSISHNASPSGSGAGMYSSGVVDLRDSAVAHNSAASVSGIFNAGGDVTISASRLYGNTAYAGGCLDNQGTMRVVNSTISDNHATYGYGGAIANLGPAFGANGVLTVVDCVIAGNSAGWGGGGIADFGGHVTIVDTEFVNNSSYEGGGLLTSGTVTVRGSSFTGNSAERGGGVYNEGAITLQDCTLVGNAAALGGDLYNRIDPYVIGVVHLFDSTVGDRYDG